jgi:hypothetical protein
MYNNGDTAASIFTISGSSGPYHIGLNHGLSRSNGISSRMFHGSVSFQIDIATFECPLTVHFSVIDPFLCETNSFYQSP